MAQEENKFGLVNRVGLNDLVLQIAYKESSISSSWFTKRNRSVAEDEIVGAVAGSWGGGVVRYGLFVEIQVYDDFLGEVGVGQFLVELGIIYCKELRVGELQKFIVGEGGWGGWWWLVGLS